MIVELNAEEREFLDGVLQEFPQFVEDYDINAKQSDIDSVREWCAALRAKLRDDPEADDSRWKCPKCGSRSRT